MARGPGSRKERRLANAEGLVIGGEKGGYRNVGALSSQELVCERVRERAGRMCEKSAVPTGLFANARETVVEGGRGCWAR